jgi:hypothetical protein
MNTTCTKTVHENELPFMYYIFIYPIKLRMYHISKLLRVFLNILYNTDLLYKNTIFHIASTNDMNNQLTSEVLQL